MGDKIFSILKHIGIPVAFIVIAVGIGLLIKNYYETRLTIFQIRQIKKELGDNTP